MDSFWKWLMRANARGVLAAALVALIVTVGWWAWREYNAGPPGSSMPPLRERTASRTDLDELAFLDEQLTLGPECPADNPFLFYRRRHVAGGPTQPTPEPPRAPAIGPQPESLWPIRQQPRRQQPQPEPDPEPQPPPPESVTLTYKGIFKRSDGSVVALVRDSKTERSAFYKTGARLHWIHIGDFDTTQADIITADGSVTRIKLGEPETFEEE